MPTGGIKFTTRVAWQLHAASKWSQRIHPRRQCHSPAAQRGVLKVNVGGIMEIVVHAHQVLLRGVGERVLITVQCAQLVDAGSATQWWGIAVPVGTGGAARVSTQPKRACCLPNK